MAPIPITIITGFLGSGKTTMILNLLPQIRAVDPKYKLALLKNEFGDLAVDSQLAGSEAISGVQEMLGGCICCNLVGQLGEGLAELARTVRPDRIVIETSGSAFPATLALEVNRLVRSTGDYVLDGVVNAIDVENWKGYEDTSYTAKMQARYTDLIVFNKWEGCDERRFDECLDRVGDLELETPWIKSDKGKTPVELVFGIGGKLSGAFGDGHESETHGHDHEHKHDHQSEIEVLSIELQGPKYAAVNADKLQKFLQSSPREEVYRIKAVLTASSVLRGSDEDESIPTPPHPGGRYIINWAFGRWTSTPVSGDVKEHESSRESTLRMTMMLARYESVKWKKKLETGGMLELEGDDKGSLVVTRIS